MPEPNSGQIDQIRNISQIIIRTEDPQISPFLISSGTPKEIIAVKYELQVLERQFLTTLNAFSEKNMMTTITIRHFEKT
ncbi:1128_t:CDS:2, partial [Rhizophagus irregularis]